MKVLWVGAVRRPSESSRRAICSYTSSQARPATEKTARVILIYARIAEQDLTNSSGVNSLARRTQLLFGMSAIV